MSCEPGPRSNEILVYLQALPEAMFYRFATGIPPTDSLECALVRDPPCIWDISRFAHFPLRLVFFYYK